jgi:hypothetical protein
MNEWKERWWFQRVERTPIYTFFSGRKASNLETPNAALTPLTESQQFRRSYPWSEISWGNIKNLKWQVQAKCEPTDRCSTESATRSNFDSILQESTKRTQCSAMRALGSAASPQRLSLEWQHLYATRLPLLNSSTLSKISTPRVRFEALIRINYK